MRTIKYISLIVTVFASEFAQAQEQELTLQHCYAMAEQNYPLMKQRNLIHQTHDYTIANLTKGNFPQLGIFGQATYQSDVTEIPISIPGMDVPVLSKEQYRIYGEVNQPLTDVITVKRQKKLQEANSAIQENNLDVELYKIKERINQLFFGVLLIDEQLAQNELLKKDIRTGMAKIEAAVQYGSELKSSFDKLKAELLRVDQRSLELKISRKSYLEVLGLFINQAVSENTILKKPESVIISDQIRRPELKLFESQKRALDVQNQLITTRNIPRLSLFVQGGVGRPSPVNMLSNDVTPYYIAGVRLSWNLSAFYTSSNERQLLVLNQNMVEAQKETFVFNTNLGLKQQHNEITKLQELIRRDDEIIALRTTVKEASNLQLENGVITVNDFLREVNAEDQARQNKLLHEIQLLMAQYSHQTTAGDLDN